MPDDGELTITAGGQTLKGWKNIELIQGMEICPTVFNISFTEKYSADSPKVVMVPGDECQVKIGGDLVMTGYIDRLRPMIRARAHGLAIAGRSKSADFVDCAAEWEGGQIKGNSVLEIAKKLAKPYGIGVEGEVDTGPPLPQLNLTIGETPYSIIERLARSRGLLIFDLPNGNLVLAQAGSEKMASGFTQGENILEGEAEYSMDQRFSEYKGFITGVDVLQDLGDGGNLQVTVTDPGVKRHRLRTIIAENSAMGVEQLKPRCLWEAARRAGRSNMVSVTVDSWRDSGGKLWTPNAMVDIEAPTLKLPKGTNWLIAQVVFRRNEQDGTSATIVAMPKEAFLPEPILLQPLSGDILQATQ
jgi:prophage tail gpP-like protein